MKQPIAKVWTFCSDFNPDKEYETLQYADGSTSCNCPGWTRRVVDGSRSCKHTRLVDQGRADQQCVASHSYTDANPQPINSNTNNANRKLKTSKTPQTPRLGERKFAL